MANQVFNRSLGRAAEFYNRVDTNDPANSTLIFVAVVAGTTTDGQFKDFDTLAECLPGGGGAAEATNTGYLRTDWQMDDTDLATFAPDDTNDRVDLNCPDQTQTAVSAGDNWTDLILGYDNDSTAGTDANIVPISLHDFVVTPDGSDITAQIDVAGFFRAS